MDTELGEIIKGIRKADGNEGIAVGRLTGIQFHKRTSKRDLGMWSGDMPVVFSIRHRYKKINWKQIPDPGSIRLQEQQWLSSVVFLPGLSAKKLPRFLAKLLG